MTYLSWFLSDSDMKKDIDTLIAEERADIISKYDKVGVIMGLHFPSKKRGCWDLGDISTLVPF